MLQRIRFVTLPALMLFALVAPTPADDWQPILPEELQMKSEPLAPKAPAIFLYRQVDRDDANFSEGIYSRIKILTEEGRKYANVEIPYYKGSNTIRGLSARVIRPDGGVVEFDGTVYEKQLVKARGVRMMAKTFTLPNVTVGSIIEYRYRKTMPMGWVYDSRWLLSDELFTRRAKFTLRPNSTFLLRWSWPIGLPPDTKPPENERGLIRLETQNIPAFVSEEYMPPENIMKYRVEFVYEDGDSDQKEEAAYWKAYGKRMNTRVQRFSKPGRALEQEVARLVQPGDSAETQARKLYARAQQIRNLSFERQATEQEAQREKLEDNADAADVLENGHGSADDVTWFYYGLLRAAKIEATMVLISTRDRNFFSPKLMNTGDLNTSVVYAKLGEEPVFLDPGVPHMPFAYLPWNETAVKGLRLNADGGDWVNTSLPRSADSRVERKATLKMDQGTLEGKVTVTYSGLEASWRRLSERNEDATDRRKFLEDDLEGSIPSGSDVKLINTPDWAGSETPLVAEFELRVQGWAAAAGSRAIFPVGLFGGNEKHMFEHSNRVHPLYFMFPYHHLDEIDIELPSDWQVSAVPKARAADINVFAFKSNTQSAEKKLNIRRELTLNTILVQQKFYGDVRDFYQLVRSGDEDQIVITPVPPSAGKTAAKKP